MDFHKIQFVKNSFSEIILFQKLKKTYQHTFDKDIFNFSKFNKQSQYKGDKKIFVLKLDLRYYKLICLFIIFLLLLNRIIFLIFNL